MNKSVLEKVTKVNLEWWKNSNIHIVNLPDWAYTTVKEVVCSGMFHKGLIIPLVDPHTAQVLTLALVQVSITPVPAQYKGVIVKQYILNVVCEVHAQTIEEQLEFEKKHLLPES